MILYIVERRNYNGIVEDSDCFLSSSLENVKTWILNNQDFDTESSNWYWCVLKIIPDDEYGAELFKIFSREGIELENKPII